MKAKKIVYMVIMEAYDVDSGCDCEIVLFERREDAQLYWKQCVDVEMFDKDSSWVAEAYDNGGYDSERYELVLTEDYFAFHDYDREVVWSIEEKDVR